MKTKEYYLNQIPRYGILSNDEIITAGGFFNLTVHTKHDLLLTSQVVLFPTLLKERTTTTWKNLIGAIILLPFTLYNLLY